MKIGLITCLLVVQSMQHVLGQGGITVESKHKEVFVKAEDCRVAITLKNNSKELILVSPNPVISDVISGFGNIQIQLEVLDSSCYSIVSTEMDPGTTVFEKYIRNIRPLDSIVHIVNLRNFFIFQKKRYRYRVQYSYSSNDQLKTCVSDWYYFIVGVNRIKRTENFIMFREEKQ